MSNFKLDSQLQNDSIFLKENSLFQWRLLKNSSNPWILIIPKIEGVKEISDLDDETLQKLSLEIKSASRVLEKDFSPDKINIGALGNIVSQLHIHVIARYKIDHAWPGPIWGTEAKFVQKKFDIILNKILD